MFGDLMGNMQAQQEQMQKKLKEIKIVHEEEGFVIEINAAKEVLNIELPESLLNTENQEQLQDLLIVQLNRAIEKADEKQSSESANILNDLLPGGLGGILGG